MRKKLLLLAACFVAVPAAVWSGNATLPVMRGDVVGDAARLTFEWPKNVPFSATVRGNELFVTFERDVNPSFGGVLKSLYPYIVSAERKSDGKTVVFSLDKPYRIRTFTNDAISGVELLGIDPGERRVAKQEAQRLAALMPAAGEEAAPAAAPVTETPPAEPPKAESAPAEAPQAAPPKTETPKIAEEPETKPATDKPVVPEVAIPRMAPPAEEVGSEEAHAEEEKENSAPAPSTPASVPAPAPAPAAVAEETLPADNAAPAKEMPAQESPQSSAPVVPETPASAAAPAGMEAPEVPMSPEELAKQQQAKGPATHVKIGVSAANDNAVLRFPFSERTALAAFVRARTLWVAWYKPLPPDLSDFNELPRTVIGKAEVVPAKDTMVIRMPIDDGVFVGVAKQEESFEWAILVTPKKRDLGRALPVQVNTDPPAPSHVFVPALEASEPVTVKDPQVGDELIITPFYATSEGVGLMRDFVEFSLLQTAQGMAVVKKAEDTAVLALRNGLRISTPKGAVLTPGLPSIEKAKAAAEASQQDATLFPYDQWKLSEADPVERRKQMLALFHRIVESDNPQDANNARLRLAEIKLSDGLAPEAIGYLDGINRTNPAFYRSSKLSALRGAANFLMYRFTDAARDFAAAELNNNQEADYWRNMLSDLLGNPDQNYDYLSLNTDYLSKYPPIFRQRLAIVAADRSIASKDYNTALKIFDTLTQDNLIEPINNYVNFLMAKISADNNQEQEAIEIWDKLATDYHHPFVQSRAEFSRILWELERNTLSKDEAIDRLERLRLGWHGDGLELNILTMLGDFYAEKNDYVNAMRIWHNGILSFPNTSASIDMSRKMQEAFITMFNEGLAEKLPPLEALSLYYEYQSYTPTGNTGYAIINRLADRLVSVDLLRQAASLLDRQMKFASEKEKRSDIGARLAEIYLLNHQPKKALEALQESVYGENSLMLRLKRNRLTARALAEMDGPSDKILETLSTDNSPEAERIRIGIYWKEKDWARLTSSIENILKTRKDVTAPVTLEESEYLLRLALAYVFQNNRAQLHYLHDYFGPLMAKNPNREVFEFITGSDIQLTTTNFEEVMKKIADTRSFIEGYSARIQTAGIENAAPANP